jgi:CBS domain-containing protein
MNKVSHILDEKGTTIHTICGSQSVLDAITKMDENQIGCLLVIAEDGGLCGLISERDILRCFARNRAQDCLVMPLDEVMTTEVIVCKASDHIDAVRNLMKTKRIRQIPVIDDDGRLQGIVSIGDVNAHLIQEEECEIVYLHEYIEGRVR